ncbi:hypothetical protein [Palleronia abyssalis]|uniref:hypothetical protein n=1 Tax=Palleronia abyssalis TaxID=1501240 RepID=UPI0015E80D71|nr:hypothetical protein [Palleronia abyssalis]
MISTPLRRGDDLSGEVGRAGKPMVDAQKCRLNQVERIGLDQDRLFRALAPRIRRRTR